MRRLLLALLLACACARPSPDARTDGAGGLPAAPVHAVVVVPRGAPAPATEVPTVVAEVVATRAAREVGLSNRDRLDRDAGMLFVYADDRPRRYWMKDCLIGLDIAFLRADGEIACLATLPPGAGLSGGDVPIADCPRDVRYVLETNAGWFARHRIGVGARVDVRAATEGVVPE